MGGKSVTVLLKQEQSNLGKQGDVVKVRPGFARNFLIPRGLGVLASHSNIKAFEHEQKVVRASLERRKEAMLDRVKKLENLVLTIAKKVSDKESGKLFGSVSAIDIIEALQKIGIEGISRTQVEIADGRIKQTGMFPVSIHVSEDVQAPFQVHVVAEES